MNKPKLDEASAQSLSLFVQRVIRQKGLSIREVQTRAGGNNKIAASYISRIITGKVTNLSVDKLSVLAEGLGVDPFELFAAASGHKPANAARGVTVLELIDIMGQAVSNPESLELMQRWLRLSPEYQASVLRWVRYLSQETKSRKQKSGKQGPNKHRPKKR